ncbi:MAG TPA: putative baseplate assembly protein [Acidimicrobiales bacterium]|jgi:predicted phage baseplate assembly protein|nr:putative baseplate assembly protein [Acidimicrobiales bacterium]
MALPAPNLDDRRFQDLVDEAKRLVQQRCPEWTDHNVSDPGVTLIEAFATMVDQVVYRLNRLPDRNYIKFLELIGVRLFPPVAANAPVTFWLSAPRDEPLVVPVGTQVSTLRTETEESINFSVTEELAVVPAHAAHVLTAPAPEDDDTAPDYLRHDQVLLGDAGFPCFSHQPVPGDTMLVGLSDPVPSNIVVLRLDCHIEGVGVDPRWPPLAWEAWDGEAWRACEVDHDDTGGLNRGGDIVLHVPRRHAVGVFDRSRGGWLRCRVTDAEEGQPSYSISPRVDRMSAFTIGGTTATVHAQLIEDEVIGISDGVGGQRFRLEHSPVVASADLGELEVAGGSGWQLWDRVATFADSSPDDRHYLFDEVESEVIFGPGVRLADGSYRQYGAVPPKGVPVRIKSYRIGGGREGNVAREAIRILRTTIPFVSSVRNRRAAAGGVDGETVEEAKVRGPITLRTGNRAVTIEDYEHLAREAAPEVSRVRCVPAGRDEGEAGAVRILIVPTCEADATGRLQFEQLVPAEETLAAIGRYLDERRVIGARVLVEPPTYQGITVVARIRGHVRFQARDIEKDAVAALYRYFSPVTGGPDGDGWPFGRPLHAGEVYAVLQRIPGVEYVQDVRLFGADPISGQRGDAVQRLELGPNSLVFSHEHLVRVD